MKRIVECVPNISEGRNKEVIQESAAAARIEGPHSTIRFIPHPYQKGIPWCFALAWIGLRKA